VTVRSPGEPEIIPDIPEKTAPSLRKEMPTSDDDYNDYSDLADTNGKENEKEFFAIADDSNHFTNYVNPDQEMESEPGFVPESNAEEIEPIEEIEDKENPGQPVIRRRRRRSSAQED
jgi:hypothetical protein